MIILCIFNINYILLEISGSYSNIISDSYVFHYGNELVSRTGNKGIRHFVTTNYDKKYPFARALYFCSVVSSSIFFWSPNLSVRRVDHHHHHLFALYALQLQLQLQRGFTERALNWLNCVNILYSIRWPHHRVMLDCWSNICHYKHATTAWCRDIWNMLHAAHWKYRTQKWRKNAIWAPSHNFVRLNLRNWGTYRQSEKKLAKQQYLVTDRAVASHLLVGVLTTLLGVLDD